MTVDLNLIKEARETVKDVVSKTPIFTASRMKENLYIKMENLQKTGSFKIRGAYNKIAHLTDEEKAKGVITSSAGNHAQGVALSATQQGIKSFICIPSIAPLSKIEATRGYGGEVIIVDGTFDDAQARSYEIQKERDLTYVHPFDDQFVIAGQGTIGLEILEENPDIDIIVVPVGGGGLLAGIAVAAKSVKPDIKIVGVEAENAASMRDSLEAGKRITLDSSDTIADGIAVKCPGELTFKLIQEYVDEIVTVSEDEIQNAILRLLEESKVTAEGAGATSVAAVINDKIDTEGKKVCAVLSGGNININMVNRIIENGLYKSGRLAEYTVALEDRPGELIRFLEVIRNSGANILTITQYHEGDITDIHHAVVRTVVETFNEEHRHELNVSLAKAGYQHLKLNK